MMKVLILSAKSYDFTNDDNERLCGTKISYLVDQQADDDCLGFPPMSATLTKQDLMGQVKTVPAIYNIDFTLKSGKNNKAELVLSKLELVKPFELKF